MLEHGHKCLSIAHQDAVVVVQCFPVSVERGVEFLHGGLNGQDTEGRTQGIPLLRALFRVDDVVVAEKGRRSAMRELEPGLEFGKSLVTKESAKNIAEDSVPLLAEGFGQV